jgi:DNA polymerase sigma
MQRESSQFFIDNAELSIRLVCISPSIDINDLLKEIQTFVDAENINNNAISDYYLEKGEQHLHLWLFFTNKQCVLKLLSIRLFPYKESKFVAKAVRKQKAAKVVNTKKSKKDQQTVQNPFPVDRINSVIQSEEEMERLVVLSQSVISMNCIQKSYDSIREVVRREYGLAQVDSVTTEENESTPLIALHKIAAISTLFILEQYPHHNGQYLSQQYLHYLSRVTDYKSPVTKQLIIQQSFQHICNEVNMSELLHTIDSKLNLIKPTEEVLQRRNNIMKRLNEICHTKQYLNHYNSFIYGSAGTDFLQVDSDFDIALLSENTEVNTLPLEARLELLKEVLGKEPDFKELHIYGGQKPVLKSYFEGVSTDICFDHHIGVVNTQFLQTYSTVDSRLKHLVLIIKTWAKARYMCDSSHGNLSSYCFSLMCIYYLQQIGILPNLQALANHPDVKSSDCANYGKLIDGFNCTYVENIDKIHQIWKSSNTVVPVAALLVGFFQFYSNFDFSKYTVNPRISNPAIPQNKQANVNKYGLSDFVSIEDPLDYRDLAFNVHPNRMHKLQEAIHETHLHLVSNRFDKLFTFEKEINYMDYHEDYTNIGSDNTIVKGQLIVDGTTQVVVTDNNEEIGLLSRGQMNRTCHGDEVIVRVSDYKVISKLDLKCQLVPYCAMFIDKHKTFCPVDRRYEIAFLPQLSLFGIEYETFINTEVELLLEAKRINPWKVKKNMQAMPTLLYGCKLDINAQTRALYAAHYTNNYSVIPRNKQEFNGADLIHIPAGVYSELDLYVSIEGNYLTVCLPDSISQSADGIDKIVLQLVKQDEGYIMHAVHSVTVPSSSITISNNGSNLLREQLEKVCFPITICHKTLTRLNVDTAS